MCAHGMWLSSGWLWGRQQQCWPSGSKPGVYVLGSAWSYHLPPGGVPSSCRLIERFVSAWYVYPLRGNQDTARWWTIVSWLSFLSLCIPSLLWLVTVWIYPLELQEGLGSWNLFPTKKKWGLWKGFGIRKILLGFNFGHWLLSKSDMGRSLISAVCGTLPPW